VPGAVADKRFLQLKKTKELRGFRISSQLFFCLMKQKKAGKKIAGLFYIANDAFYP
jgi:hypothetical protein